MKPIAFFFTQFTDYGQLIKEQANKQFSAPHVYKGGKR